MPENEERLLKQRSNEILNRWPAVGLAVGVVRDGALASFHGAGWADVASGTPVTTDTVFRIASISKTFTAIAVLQLWERGLLDLDAPANEYLRAYRLVPARVGWRPATVRHLLTHTAGVPQVVHPTRMVRSGWFGESVEAGQPRPNLASYYGRALRLAAEPGTTFTYTDHGFATLGQIVEDTSGESLDGYLRRHVFEPLGMADSALDPSERLRARLATGYRLGRHGVEPVRDRQWVTAAASAVCSTPADMARYVAALLRGGDGEHDSILKPETVAMMFEPHHQPDPRIPGMGLSFFRADLGGHRAVEHQGVLPGFNAQISLAPDDGVGVVGFTNGARQAIIWLTAEMERLLRDQIGVDAPRIRTDVPHHPEVWGEICGRYRARAPLTDLQTWSMGGAGIDVSARRGALLLRARSPLPALLRGLVLHPDDEADPYVFRLDLSAYGMGTAKVVFGREDATTRISLDAIPLSAGKRPRRPRSARWVTAAGGALAAAAVVKHRRPPAVRDQRRSAR